jgi:hypothetical protein
MNNWGNQVDGDVNPIVAELAIFAPNLAYLLNLNLLFSFFPNALIKWKTLQI